MMLEKPGILNSHKCPVYTKCLPRKSNVWPVSLYSRDVVKLLHIL